MKKIQLLTLLQLCLLAALGLPALAQQEAPLFDVPKRLPDAINSEMEESLPLLSADGKTLYFVRVLHPDNTGGKVSGHDIWYARRNDDGSWQEPKNTLLGLNNKGNNAILGFGQEGNRMYLLNNYGGSGSYKTGISFAEYTNNRWGYPQDFAIPRLKKEGFFYNAYISPDEEVLIVSMQRKGQPGDEDLYISTKGENGRWTELQNMGTKINTGGFESFPFLTADKQTLYFSSNGHGGHGDADIFMSTRQDESWTNWSRPVNLGRSVNSKGFDAAFVIYPDSTAFFVSNRQGGMSDIYQTRLSPAVPEKDPNQVPIVFEEMTEEELEAMKPTDEDNSMADLSDSRKEAIVVEDVYPLTVSIYFAFDSYELSPEAHTKLRELFQKYTVGDVRVTLTGHTDAIGTEAYNKRLSINRAQSAEDFLLKAGLARERVKTDGKGELEPVASNETAEGRRQNRRVTIKVVK
ncbi:OmpA family protein [Cesiribacter andamanensis]|uniref:Outer membrane protein ArfA n=1 Tax=Cesiribacter andamanensis AMV16 TaxID=1279009 RepID=M7P0P6_9BACT|nr:OmpA family protein [Cesiribacter andamanensis]EMR04164.1 Outer membrane protein ArfA [Cesiribacter andamanensis AMV16]